MMRKNWQLSAAEKADARRAMELLSESGITLTEAVERLLAVQPALQAVPKVSLSRSVADFITDGERRGLRGGTLHFYEGHLSTLVGSFRGMMSADITAAKLSAWFDGLPHSAGGKDALWRAFRAYFRWAKRAGHCLVDPTENMNFRMPAVDREPGFLSVDTVKAILQGAASPYREALALQFFAGLRPSEVSCTDGKRGLRWEHINREEQIIRIPSAVAKGTRRRSSSRLIEKLPENIWSWLEGAPSSGYVFPMQGRALIEHAKRVAGITSWPYDGARHSFATYHVAFLQEPGRTALILGHGSNPAMLYQHYRGLATHAQGEAYFAITPGKGPDAREN